MAPSKLARLSPNQVLILGFALIIAGGTLLLSLPLSSSAGESIGLMDSFFMATSALCVTGLAVVEMDSFSLFGQLVLLTLAQVGGLGFMTFAVFIAVLLGRRVTLQQRLFIRHSFLQINLSGTVRLVLAAVSIALAVEAAGALLLFFRFLPVMPWEQALYHGLFHAVSAFNSAGFSLWPDSLQAYAGDALVNLVFSIMVIIGGLGFTVILELLRTWQWRRLSLHTRLVVLTTVFLVVGGWLLLLLFELGNAAHAGMTWTERLWTAYFQSVTTRSAGFTTVELGEMTSASHFLMVLLMFIGAAPGSTGGGIKTVTFALLLITLYNIAKGRSEVSVMQRRIPTEQIFRALAIVLLAMLLVILVTLLLSVTEQGEFMVVLFEVVSAFGTVGLSLGLTPELTPLGKVVLSLCMFVGRVGPLTLAYVLAQRRQKVSHIRYPEESIMIG